MLHAYPRVWTHAFVHSTVLCGTPTLGFGDRATQKVDKIPLLWNFHSRGKRPMIGEYTIVEIEILL